ncbi:uncharacterized protein LOC126752794 isoform X1 [Bactrocera neohumeralis]|uniref:uncharacterized protein LOC126752794 isoform X1 n=1 Tax=Bactrocera neohumeralis TaxID=98809 RepID=UPI0021661562|nr:uncharacterized protein LOC126752794 isoform X1 [Bactrocera neohumeralis]
MDLKALLLNSISSKQPLLLNRRMHIGKCCYSVTFEVDGKMLTVIRIRQIYTKAPFQMRVQRRQRFLQKLKSCSSISSNSDLKPKSSPTRTILPQFADSSTQTTKPEVRSRSTETEIHTLPVHREQQTHRRVLRKQGTQTDPNTLCHGVQTERKIFPRATQTNESCAAASTTQTESYCYNNQVQTEPFEDDLSAEREKEAVVFMLNEIGEMIINQNHLLQNNTTMLSQMSEMTMLKKVAAQQKSCMNYEKKYKFHRFTRKHGRFRYSPMPSKALPVDKSFSSRNQWAQTIYPIGLSTKTTQTRQEIQRRKRFSLFCFKL